MPHIACSPKILTTHRGAVAFTHSRKFFLWFGVAMFLASPLAQAGELFVAPEHDFKIEFPVEPNKTESEQQTASGLARLVRYQARHEEFRTALTVVTFSREAFSEQEVATGLRASRDNQVNRLKGELVSEKDIAIDGHAGKELVIAVGPPGKPRDFRYRVRTYYVGNRQYLMSVIGTPQQVVAAEADAFFASFTLDE